MDECDICEAYERHETPSDNFTRVCLSCGANLGHHYWAIHPHAATHRNCVAFIEVIDESFEA